jgi:haloacetate dehalogenase
MQQLGFARFSLVGHDRGANTAFRCAMDHPESIEKLVIIDSVPIIEALDRTNAHFASSWWHWFFFGVPEKPERAINADPDAWYGHDRVAMGPANHDDFLAAIHNPAVVHGMVEDYRAGLGIDPMHDQADRALGRKITFPTLFLWSSEDDMVELYRDPLSIWKNWALDVEGYPIESGHHVAEENPRALADALIRFLENSDRSPGGALK